MNKWVWSTGGLILTKKKKTEYWDCVGSKLGPNWDQIGTSSVRGLLLNVGSDNHIKSFASDKQFEQVNICKWDWKGTKR